jgi:hypothetical protein
MDPSEQGGGTWQHERHRAMQRAMSAKLGDVERDSKSNESVCPSLHWNSCLLDCWAKNYNGIPRLLGPRLGPWP